MRKPHALLPLFLVFAAPLVGAAEPVLVEAWRGVVAHSPEYAAAVARRDAGSAFSAAARALWMPTLAAQGGVAHRAVESSTTGAEFSAPAFGTSTGVDFRTSINGGSDVQWALLAQQPIIDAARVADAEAMRARARQAAAQFRQVEQRLMVRTAETLAATVEAGARFRAVQRQRDSAMRARDVARERYESGDLPVTEWREAQAQADQLAIAELDAQQTMVVANAAYTELTGLVPPPMPTGDSRADEGVVQGDVAAAPVGKLQDWLQRAATQSPQIQLQQEQLAMAEAEARRWARIDGFHLNLVGEYGRDSVTGHGDYGPAGLTQRMAGVGLQATLPLFTGGLRAAQRHAADAALRAAQADLESMQQQLELQTRAAWLAAGNARARLSAQQRAKVSAAARLDATRIGHEAGDRTLLDVLTAEGAALQAEAVAMGARCDGLVAMLKLAEAAGTLDATTLQEHSAGEFACGTPPVH